MKWIRRVSPSGKEMNCHNTNRQRAASSMAHGKFVAARTKTRGLVALVRAAAADARLLHCIKNSVFNRPDASLAPVPDREHSNESISSTKMILGDKAFARENRALTSFSDSPC